MSLIPPWTISPSASSAHSSSRSAISSVRSPKTPQLRSSTPSSSCSAQ
jgi:hypothetical protein